MKCSNMAQKDFYTANLISSHSELQQCFPVQFSAMIAIKPAHVLPVHIYWSLHLINWNRC